MTEMEQIESYCIKRAIEDPVLINDSLILETLLLSERRNIKDLPSPSFFDANDNGVRKTQIKAFMRKVVANWMLEVCEEQRCEEDVFPLSMNYLDRIIKGCPNLKKTQLQLLGATCMFIASKLKETIPLTGEKLVLYTDNSITLQDLMDFEMIVLYRLNWDLSIVTPHDFLEQILCRIPSINKKSAQTIRRHAQTFIALCATEFKFTSCMPSMIAAASISAAASGLLGQKLTSEMQLYKELQDIIGYDAECIRTCQAHIEKSLTQTVPPQPHTPNHQSTPQHNNGGAKYKNGPPTTPTDVRDVSV